MAVAYPNLLHLQKAYHHLGYKNGDSPETERVAVEIVSLPMLLRLTQNQQSEVADKVIEFVTRKVDASHSICRAQPRVSGLSG
jgi:dTDP-4-amino-4,6-dideoxygalactose transaminase